MFIVYVLQDKLQKWENESWTNWQQVETGRYNNISFEPPNGVWRVWGAEKSVNMSSMTNETKMCQTEPLTPGAQVRQEERRRRSEWTEMDEGTQTFTFHSFFCLSFGEIVGWLMVLCRINFLFKGTWGVISLEKELNYQPFGLSMSFPAAPHYGKWSLSSTQ